MPKTEHWQWYVEESAPTEAHHHAIENVFFSGRSDFQQVAVISTPVFGKMLILDGDTQSSQGDEKIYHETLVHPALAGSADRSEVLILGGGEGATLREVLRHPGVARCTMVDIDGLVVDLSKKYLPEWADGAFDEPRANVIIGDALAYMREHDERYGVIISDLTEPLEDSPSNFLFNEEVFKLIKSRLATAAFTCCRRAPRRSTTTRCTARWRARCDGITNTSPRFSPTFLRSIPTGRSSPAATASISQHSILPRSMPTARSCAGRISSTTGRRTAAVFAPALPSSCARRRRSGILRTAMHTDFASAPHHWEKEKSHFVALLDLKLENVEHGKATMRMPYRPEIANGAGAVHGGAIVSLCDTVFYVALASIYGREQDTVTVSLQCNFLAPAFRRTI